MFRHYVLSCYTKNLLVKSSQINQKIEGNVRYSLGGTEECKKLNFRPNTHPKTNKSGLLPQHRNQLMKIAPYAETSSWIHLTEKYQRTSFGRFGHQAKILPSICFNTKVDYGNRSFANVTLSDLNEMISNIEIEIQKKRELQIREIEIEDKLCKLEHWKLDLKNKILKREGEANAVKEKRDRLIEEVRRHFGFKVDYRDERFKEMLEQRELADKKKLKEAKRKAREEKMVSKLEKN